MHARAQVLTLHPPHTTVLGPWAAKLRATAPSWAPLAMMTAERWVWGWMNALGLGNMALPTMDPQVGRQVGRKGGFRGSVAGCGMN
jgi:hypothetical protein